LAHGGGAARRRDKNSRRTEQLVDARAGATLNSSQTMSRQLRRKLGAAQRWIGSNSIYRDARGRPLDRNRTDVRDACDSTQRGHLRIDVTWITQQE
jgi:hypothetical protein